ncbi:hypothetical protein ACPPVO_01640 [Dactylosporangium sp. McL0621]|uniref:hypothetical protein n=1 Tax=Dactylosporangium sp. McL0621 TaxID=3415678 RepID=UPI003CEFE96C
MLFFVPDEARKRNLLQHLGRGPLATPAATAAAARISGQGGVADAVWRPVTAPDVPLRLIDLGSLGDPADDATLYRLDRRP